MEWNQDTSILDTVLETFFLVEVMREDFAVDFLDNPAFTGRRALFKAELTDAIENHTISPEKFNELTETRFKRQDQVDDFLVTEVWNKIFPDEPAPNQSKGVS